MNKPSSNNFEYSYVDMEEVIKNPDEYIIPELQDACKILWSKNIYTFICSNRNDGGHSYIMLEKLSPQNQKIFDNQQKKHPQNYVFDTFRNCYSIDFVTENLTIAKIKELFNKAIEPFVPQDVPNKFFTTKEQFLIKCGCFKNIPNPKYNPNIGPMPIGLDLKKLDEWIALSDQPPTLKIFDETKQTKPLKDYLKEHNINKNTFDPITENIYKSPYFLKRHNDYIKQTQQTSQEK